MRILLLETGDAPESIRADFDRYGLMFQRLLANAGAPFQTEIAAIHHGERPSMAGFDGMLITGSPAGVYEDHDWIEPASALIKDAATAGKPQIGICFGHQLMAQTFGGTVTKAPQGWGVGVHHYEILETEPWMAPNQNVLRCTVSHQDQIITPPPGARVLAGSTFCPHGVLRYAQGPAVSFQMHPEFEHEFAAALIRARRGRLPTDIAEDGLTSLGGSSDRALIGQWIVSFFTQHRRR